MPALAAHCHDGLDVNDVGMALVSFEAGAGAGGEGGERPSTPPLATW
jgi:hypothetical protein